MAQAARAPARKAEMSGPELAQRMRQAAVVMCSRGETSTAVIGTGFIVSSGGLVITADHVIMNEEAQASHPGLGVITAGNKEWREARVVRRFIRKEVDRNIALLQIVPTTPQEAFEFLPLAEPLGPGEPVLACAFPSVFPDLLLQPLFREGIVASDELRIGDGPAMLALDLTLVGGFSGAPVVSRLTGGVVGLLRGMSAADPETGFSVALRLFPADLDPSANDASTLVAPPLKE